IDWSGTAVPKPEFVGRRVLRDVPLAEVVPYIDWSPFFMAWGLSGKYPAILKGPKVGAEATQLFDDPRRPADPVVRQQLLTAAAVYGFFPANSDGDDILVWTDESRKQEQARLHALRQQWEREGQTSFRSLADYVAPVGTGVADYVGAFAVTAGGGAEE